MLALFGDRDDPHLQSIDACAKSRGAVCRIVPTDEESLLQSVRVSYNGPGRRLNLSVDGANFSIEDISASFIMSPLFRPDPGGDQDFRFWYTSWKEVLHGVYDDLATRSVLLNGGIGNAISCQNKIKLGQKCSEVGLNYPASIISNLKKDIDIFAADEDEIVLKTLHQLYLEKDGHPTMFLAQKIGQSDVAGFSGEGESPLFLQQFVDKSFDVRVIYVGKILIGCKIDASRSKAGCVDWRAYDLPNTVHERICVPEDVRSKTVRLMRLYSLDYACIDYCVDKLGEWWILDVNPFGKYMWMELALTLGASDTIADLLISRCETIQ